MTEEKLVEAKKFKEAIEKAEKDLQNSNLQVDSITFNTIKGNFVVTKNQTFIKAIQTLVIESNKNKLFNLKQQFDNL